MNKNVIYGIIFFLLITIVGLIVYKEFSKQNVKTKFNTIKPEIGTIERKILIQGTIVPSKEVQIKSQISGVLDELFVNIGDKVKKGEIIAKIKPVSDPVSIERLERQFKIAQTNFQNREQIFNRNKSLYEDKVISKPEFEEAEKQYLVAKHEMLSIQKEIELISEQGNTKSEANVIKATSEGIVLELPIKVGGAVMARSSFHEGTNVATIANLNSLLFQAKVLESDVAYLKQGMQFYISIGAIKNSRINAELALISPKGSISDGSVKFDIWAKILPDSNNYEVRAGYSTNAEIVLESRKNALLLSEKYVDFKNDSAFLTTVDTVKGITNKKYITVGISEGVKIEILQGVNLHSLILK